jgi:hypothetical protein
MPPSILRGSTDDTVTIDRDAERYRWLCPAGHANWEPTGEHIWCQTCYRLEMDAAHDTLCDAKAGTTIPFERVTLE